MVGALGLRVCSVPAGSVRRDSAFLRQKGQDWFGRGFGCRTCRGKLASFLCKAKEEERNERESGDPSINYDQYAFDVDEERALEELRTEFEQVVKQNWDGLELQGKEHLTERYQDEYGVEIWLEKDTPEKPTEEAQELFDWWNELDDVYVLIFQLQSEEDGIFTLKDSSTGEDEEGEGGGNFILSFEDAGEASRYAKRLSDNLQGLKAEIERMARDEILQLCKELNVGIRIVQRGGEEPDIPSYVHVDELEDIRQSLEQLLPPDEEV